MMKLVHGYMMMMRRSLIEPLKMVIKDYYFKLYNDNRVQIVSDIPRNRLILYLNQDLKSLFC